MVYGDGDGSTFSNLANGLDVTSHELTHAVCSRTANLAYQKESGALNEANSDILGRSAAFWGGNGSASATSSWTIGADVYTPGTSGDALRYMYDPAKDGQSADYYPTRNYSGTCTPSSSNDECGVHTNSGIANLFYFLLSQGGTHPRGKTTVAVTGVGITKAQQIWYRALSVYMTSTTNFQGARTATASAASDLYGGTCTAEWQAVHKAWDAVGVPGTWSCGTTYTVAGNAGTTGATVTAGSVSTTSDTSGNYTLAGLAAGTYTVERRRRRGCTFSPTSLSVTVGPSATGQELHGHLHERRHGADERRDADRSERRQERLEVLLHRRPVRRHEPDVRDDGRHGRRRHLHAVQRQADLLLLHLPSLHLLGERDLHGDEPERGPLVARRLRLRGRQLLGDRDRPDRRRRPTRSPAAPGRAARR